MVAFYRSISDIFTAVIDYLCDNEINMIVTYIYMTIWIEEKKKVKGQAYVANFEVSSLCTKITMIINTMNWKENNKNDCIVKKQRDKYMNKSNKAYWVELFRWEEQVLRK